MPVPVLTVASATCRADGHSQVCYAIFWVVASSLLVLFGAQVIWLRKALLHLEVTRVLPVEYGTVTTLSVLGSLVLFQEHTLLTPPRLAAVFAGIVLILLGCALVGSRTAPLPCGRSGIAQAGSSSAVQVARRRCGLPSEMTASVECGSTEGGGGTAHDSPTVVLNESGGVQSDARSRGASAQHI